MLGVEFIQEQKLKALPNRGEEFGRREGEERGVSEAVGKGATEEIQGAEGLERVIKRIKI